MVIVNAIKGLYEIIRAMLVTLKYFFTKPLTVQYPKQKINLYPRFRGRHELQRREDGLELCVGCGLCAAICPARAIYVEAAENTEEKRYSATERYAVLYEINYTRCIFCGFCEEACPTGALKLGNEFALTRKTRPELVMGKETLLVPATPHAIILED
jgi:NADH-quinone oxidoreductase subunit I